MIGRHLQTSLKALAICGASIALAVPALADAVTYMGTLGKSRIVVEFTRDPIAPAGAKPLAARYFYPPQGVDIPLQPGKAKAGGIVLQEEKPCTDNICHDPKEGQNPKPPIGARWTLSPSADGSVIEGSWQGVDSKASPLPVRLQRVAGRPTGKDFDDTPQGLVDLTEALIDQPGQSIASNSTPYDFLKMQEPLTPGVETVWGDVGFRYVVDPRTKFRYPRISRLPGMAADAAANIPANRYLQGRHWDLNFSALACKAEQYQGFGWNELVAFAAGTLGGFDEETIEVTYLSPRLMSWTESGSLFCGGAHPDNHDDSYTIDVSRGIPLDMGLIFSGWVPYRYGEPATHAINLDEARAAAPDTYSWGPDKELAAFVKHNRRKQDAQMEKDCGYDDLIADNLAIRFAQGDRVVFTLEGLPNVINVCGGELFDRPITELRDFLTPAAADYFPVLKR